MQERFLLEEEENDLQWTGEDIVGGEMRPTVGDDAFGGQVFLGELVFHQVSGQPDQVRGGSVVRVGSDGHDGVLPDWIHYTGKM